MGTIAERLKIERKRLGLNQDAMAVAAGLNRTAQIRYEKGERSPDADYLAAVAGLGVDVAFVLTGEPSSVMSSEEAELLRRYRAASAELRAAVFAGLGVAVLSGGGGGRVSISGGEQGQVIAGDAHQSAVTITVGGKKRGTRK